MTSSGSIGALTLAQIESNFEKFHYKSKRTKTRAQAKVLCGGADHLLCSEYLTVHRLTGLFFLVLFWSGCHKCAPKTRAWSDGILIANCGCARKKMIGFAMMAEHESVRVAMEFLYAGFKKAPAFVMCVPFTYAMCLMYGLKTIELSNNPDMTMHATYTSIASRTRPISFAALFLQLTGPFARLYFASSCFCTSIRAICLSSLR